jgi:putative ABC transport system permease protein
MGRRYQAERRVSRADRAHDNLFNGANAIGQTIRIKNVPFTVVGVLAAKGQSAKGRTRTTSSCSRFQAPNEKLSAQDRRIPMR